VRGETAEDRGQNFELRNLESARRVGMRMTIAESALRDLSVVPPKADQLSAAAHCVRGMGHRAEGRGQRAMLLN